MIKEKRLVPGFCFTTKEVVWTADGLQDEIKAWMIISVVPVGRRRHARSTSKAMSWDVVVMRFGGDAKVTTFNLSRADLERKKIRALFGG